MPSTSKKQPVLSDAWVLRHRPPKNVVDPNRPYACLVEKERNSTGRVEDVATVFLTNRECPFRCVMCDLWKNTTDTTVPVGAVPRQIRWALEQLPPACHIKLYNAGSFFDANAIPPEDYRVVAGLIAGFDSIIVESHPHMIGRRCWEFNELVAGDLQVAVGLETADPDVLGRLNKRMSLNDFDRAVAQLIRHDISARAFILVRPPFMTETQGLLWAKRSIDFAFDVGVECCALIPTRGGPGAMDDLAARGLFAPPPLETLETALEYGIGLARGRVFVDLWDIETRSDCRHCAAKRIDRLDRINLTQKVEPAVMCHYCGSG